MSDNYDFEKSSLPQDTNEYSPYVDKQYNGFIQDLNSGIYNNNGLTLVNFDLGQIYNSTKFTNTNDLFLAIPIVMTAAFTSNTTGGLVPPVTGNVNLLSMKTNFINLIHQADLQINGKTIESTQPYINIQKNFQMLSEMSVNDLMTVGPTLGFGESIDNFRSVSYNSNSTTASGNGFTNNKIFGTTPTVATAQVSANRYQTTCQKYLNGACINDALTSKLSRYVDTTLAAGTGNNIYPTILTSTQLQNELKPFYTVLNTNYMVWYDYAIIKLSTLFESLANIGLVRKFDCTLRLWFNTGTVGITVATPNTATPGYTISPSTNTFTNTCPLMVNYLNDLSANGGIPAAATNITAGVYVKAPPATSINGVNLALSGASSFLPACRIYYSQIQLEPTKAITYIEENRHKKVVYRSVLTNQYNNISGTFNQLINSGIVHPIGVLLVPFISSATTNGFGDFAWKSPFDSAPSTGHPISLTNFQVSVGGVNQLQSTLNYTFENFIEQVNLAETLTSSDFGISCGLFTQQYWETFRSYYVNIERSQLADKNVARNINISFTNNTAVPIDILIFSVFSDEFVIDSETGLVTK